MNDEKCTCPACEAGFPKVAMLPEIGPDGRSTGRVIRLSAKTLQKLKDITTAVQQTGKVVQDRCGH